MYMSELLTAAVAAVAVAAVDETSVVRSAVHVLRGLCSSPVSEAHVSVLCVVKSMCCTCTSEHREVYGGSCTVFRMPWHCMCVDASKTVDLLSQRAATAALGTAVVAAAVCVVDASPL